MYIEKVEIRNFKAIEDMTIEFQQGTNLLIEVMVPGKLLFWKHLQLH